MVKPAKQTQKQQSKPKVAPQVEKKTRKISKLTLAIIAFVVSAFGYQVYLKLAPYHSIIVLSNCNADDKRLEGHTLALPAFCPMQANAQYWIDPNNTYEFRNFAPCADDEGRVKCYPFTHKRTAFVGHDSFLANSRFKAVTFDPEQEIKTIFRFQVIPGKGQLFYQSNLLYRPLLRPTAEVKDQTTTYNFIVSNQFEVNNTLSSVIFEQTLDLLCSKNNSVNIIHFGINTSEIDHLNKTCVDFIETDPEQLCEGLPCANITQKMLVDSDGKYFGLHINALMRLAVGYKYGGWIMDPQTLIKETFVPERELLFLYDDSRPSVVPTTNYAFFKKESKFLFEMMKYFGKFYNKDCYSCLDTSLPKYVYSLHDFEIDVGSSEFYLPQLWTPKIYQLYKKGKFDNEVYNHFVTAKFKFWSLRFSEGLYTDFCDTKNLLYSVIAENITGKKICQ
ncbi:Conserved_hypothetical protein [Hexamita inflata]|uniref:Uncharacterized protein n=1 Tax=Hexamita inflata TaxID=28002 RepID=A0AA86UQ54_9EUKA|nr:Conserved hypothetical protein [Hexamita inflata]